MVDSSSSISVGDSPEVKEETSGFQFPPPPRLPPNGKNYEFILTQYILNNNKFILSLYAILLMST